MRLRQAEVGRIMKIFELGIEGGKDGKSEECFERACVF
jgi:hypothetical protein